MIITIFTKIFEAIEAVHHTPGAWVDLGISFMLLCVASGMMWGHCQTPPELRGLPHIDWD